MSTETKSKVYYPLLNPEIEISKWTDHIVYADGCSCSIDESFNRFIKLNKNAESKIEDFIDMDGCDFENMFSTANLFQNHKLELQIILSLNKNRFTYMKLLNPTRVMTIMEFLVKFREWIRTRYSEWTKNPINIEIYKKFYDIDEIIKISYDVSGDFFGIKIYY